MTSPPPYYATHHPNYLAPPQHPPPASLYQRQQQQYASQYNLAPDQRPRTLKKKRSAWRSMTNLRVPPPLAERPMAMERPNTAWQSSADVQAQDLGYVDCPLARGLNQGAAFCDNVAARLGEVLSRLDGDDGNARQDGEAAGEDIDALVRGMAIDEEPGPIETSRAPPKDKRHRSGHKQPTQIAKPTASTSMPLINFRKTWLYANSRLPPHLLPFKVYLPTWQILSRAATASQAVYQRPRHSNEAQTFVDADWRQGTKAMVLKTVLMDEKKLLVFAIRGSQWNFFDWAVNFKPAPTEPVGFLDDGGNACHAGFLEVAKAMVRPVAERLREVLQQDPSRATCSLVITGHSAGGAVASLLFMHMLSTTVSSELSVLTGCFRRVHCVIFGAPPVSLLPLRKPGGEQNKKNLFYSFVNEGDPVVRADKQYIYSLGRLIAAPSPDAPGAPHSSTASLTHGLRQKVSRQRLKSPEPTAQSAKPAAAQSSPPTWPVPESTLSNAGRLVLLRKKPGRKAASEAICIDDEQLRDRVFGDPAMHEMALYKRRIEELAVAAVTGREGG